LTYLSARSDARRIRFLELDEIRRELPADLNERVLLAVDCANERRIGAGHPALGGAKLVLDIDHHHDNSKFGTIN